MAIHPIPATGIENASPLIRQLGIEGLPNIAQTRAPAGADFQSVLMAGLKNVDGKISTANDLVRQFAIDDSVPVHQVTMALEEARMAMELTMQVRARLVEGYRELMNMQL